MKKKKNIQSSSKKYCQHKYDDFLLIGEESKAHYVIIKDFNTSLYYHTLNCGIKHFCRDFLPGFGTA